MAVRRSLVAGRYRLREPIGAGGMGHVWVAHDEMLHRDVAVKELVPPGWLSAEERDRLSASTLREARSAARLNHPHVVRVYDVVHADGVPWIIMEYVPSRSLHQVITQDGPLSPVEAARIGLAVLDALTAAHRAGVLHRDVKPHNVLIGHGGRVVLTDFGLATFVDDGTVTGPGLIVGSPQYVSPERARDGASTVESDLWSFGATLYAAVEGRSPYARDSAMATLMALGTKAPDPMVNAGPLATVITQLLRHDPASRLTAEQVEQRLREVGAGHEATPRTDAPVSVWPRRARRGVSAGRASVPPPAGAAKEQASWPRQGGAPNVPVHGGPGMATTEPSATGVRAHPATASGGAGLSGAGLSGAGLSGASLSGASLSGASLSGDGAGGAGLIAKAGTRSRRKRVAASAVLVALLGGATTLGWLITRDRDALGSADVASTASASSAASAIASTRAGVGGFTPAVCAGPPPPGLPRTPLPGIRGGPPNLYALPPDWSYHHDSSGFSVAAPDRWTFQKIGATLCFREPNGSRVLVVNTARTASLDPIVACRAEARWVVRSGVLPRYDEVSIAKVPFVNKAADWEYQYDGPDNIRLHAATRWFTSGKKAYALSWVTSNIDWQTNYPHLTMIQASFTTAN